MAKIFYDHKAIETKWQAAWEKLDLFQSQVIDNPQDKQYLLFAFAYPSGSGLHVGHVESMTALDILARFTRMNGHEVFFPVGWDAFGLPAENYAIKTGVHPAETTKSAIDTFRGQIKRLGVSYDWANETSTSHPEYYRWTQWLFLKLYEQGLAYRGMGVVNWCPEDQTVLANEQVVEGHCERCGALVEQKELEQWYFKITDYQDELLNGLEGLDWPEATKQQQINWIGKRRGINITYQVVDSSEMITCFTTTPVNFGATFIVLSPEYPAIDKIVTSDQRPAVKKYIQESKKHSELERTINKDKTGVFTGAYVLNHVTGKKIPVWIADFVLSNVGTGAVQGCPGHDERDFDFAKQFGIPIQRVVVGEDGDTSPVERKEQLVVKGMNGKMINSDFLNGMEFKEAMQKTMDYFEEKGWGERITTYKLRDWLISRQRYWGAPIPIVYDPEGKPHSVKAEHLPWILPTDVDFKPKGESPLKSSKEFIERTERLYGQGWRPEFDTMDTFVDSSWYFLRYVDSRNTEKFASQDKLKSWLPVDLYLIGPEHIVLHLLYARFFTKFLRDQGYLSVDEPFAKMRHQGMILGPDGKKMSKSKGNVINPDEIIERFGADTLRIYEMFMGPLETDKPWDDRAVAGVARFLRRIWVLVQVGSTGQTEPALKRKFHQTLKKVTEDIPALKFNTAIASCMELINHWESLVRAQNEAVISKADWLIFVKMLAPFAPFLAEELYEQAVGGANSAEYQGVHVQVWPQYDPALAQAEQLSIAIQVNGKVRAEFLIDSESVDNEAEILKQAKELKQVQRWIGDQKIVKEIYVPGKIVSLVV